MNIWKTNLYQGKDGRFALWKKEFLNPTLVGGGFHIKSVLTEMNLYNIETIH